MKEYSLVSIINNNAELSKALAKKIESIKNDKEKLLESAKEVSETYHDEITEGTKKKALLLSNGQSRGFTEEEIMKEHGRFIPTVRTPILNLLYYILRESKQDMERVQRFCHDLNKQKGFIDADIQDVENVDLLLENYNKCYGHLKDDDSISDNTNNGDMPEMEKYLFENCDYDAFCKIKKLKSLMQSPHEGESLSAYKKCRELCDKYHLDFEKIKG
jgi:hypothetical protein